MDWCGLIHGLVGKRIAEAFDGVFKVKTTIEATKISHGVTNASLLPNPLTHFKDVEQSTMGWNYPDNSFDLAAYRYEHILNRIIIEFDSVQSLLNVSYRSAGCSISPVSGAVTHRSNWE